MHNPLIAGLLAATCWAGTALPSAAQASSPTEPATTLSEADLKEIRALTAGGTSALLPGFGQWVFNGQQTKAVAHFAGAVVLWAIPSIVPIPDPLDRLYSAVPVLFHLYSAYDAYQDAGGKIQLVSDPLLTTWSFGTKSLSYAEPQPLEHLQLARSSWLGE